MMMIPVIDVAQLVSGSENTNNVVNRIAEAFSTVGVMQIVNHGIPSSTFDRMQHLARRFFERTDAEKNRVSYRAPVPRGYSGCCKENFACLAGERRPNDLVEKFRIGPFDFPCEADHPEYYYYHDDERAKTLFYPNKWPQEPPEFQGAVEQYYRLMEQLARTLVGAFEQCLGASKGHISNAMTRHTSILSINRYPAVNGMKHIQKGQLRLAQHTDVDLFTIVYQADEFGGLQVLANDEWISVPHVPGALVVNIGDGLQYWTNGKWKSTVHRVRLPVVASEAARQSRYSIGYFVGANYEATLVSMDADDDEYVELTYSAWRKQRIQRAMHKVKLNQ